jgi:hypothetical protein
MVTTQTYVAQAVTISGVEAVPLKDLFTQELFVHRDDDIDKWLSDSPTLAGRGPGIAYGMKFTTRTTFFQKVREFLPQAEELEELTRIIVNEGHGFHLAQIELVLKRCTVGINPLDLYMGGDRQNFFLTEAGGKAFVVSSQLVNRRYRICLRHLSDSFPHEQGNQFYILK